MALPIGLFDINPAALVVIGAIAVLLFGEQLPDVARSFGKKFNEFRKSIQSIQDEIRSAAMSVKSEVTSALDISNLNSDSPSSSASENSNGSGQKRRSSRTSDEDYEGATAPKFVPPPPVAAGKTSEKSLAGD